MADTGDRPPLANQASNNDGEATEQRMRRALGLDGARGNQTAQQRPEQARQRHRFVQDGGVPVTVLNHRTDESAALKERVGELQAALEAERHSHANTRRTLAEQQAAAQALQTRLAHSDLAHADALAGERRARELAQQALAEALAEARSRPVTRRVVRTAVVEADAGEVDAAEADTGEQAELTETADEAVTAVAAIPRKRGRPRIHPEPEPKPVRWWTPSFRAKVKR